MTTKSHQPQLLTLVPAGDPILRQKCRRLTKTEITSPEIQNFITDMRHTISHSSLGVGLSANQVGGTIAISLIAIKPTPARPNLKPFDKICINTEIIETFGTKEPLWEGCLSTARDANGEPLMAPVPRFTRIRIKYLDSNGDEHTEIVEDFVAHVVQHETDHLNGILFTDLIDPNSALTYQEYIKLTP